MKPIKPKYLNTVKVNWKVSKRTKAIISQYAKYTKYEEDEIVDMVLSQILEDKEFVDWLKSRRYQKKINDLIFNDSSLGEVENEEVEEISFT